MKVIISGGFSGPYEKLLPDFLRTSGIKVETSSGSSQGSGPQTIAAQLARGVPADVVILSREGLDELIAAKRIAAGSDVDLARTPIGVAVRAGAPKPDVATVEAFKRLMLESKRVAVPASTSGIFLIEEVFPRLGIAGKVNVTPTPRGTGAAAMVASGEADVGLLPVSEIMHAPGVQFAGLIPEEIQLHQTFCAAVVAGSREADAAKKLIGFLASDRAAATIKASGMEPLGRSRAARLVTKEMASMLARYNAWANRVIFDAVAALPAGEPEKPRTSLFKNMVHTLNHNYVIDRIFRAHLEGKLHGYTARNTPDHPPLAELRRAQEELDAWYVSWADAIAEPTLDETVRFEFVGGGEGAMTRGQMLLHIVNHTSYHRGFVADLFFQVPARPPVTDLTVYLRDHHQ